MDLETFKASLGAETPPRGLTRALQALWHQAKGDWKKAHRLAQAEGGTAGDWVHAHLHRVEGDEANAGYWYRRAGRDAPSTPLDDEWAQIVAALLSARPRRVG